MNFLMIKFLLLLDSEELNILYFFSVLVIVFIMKISGVILRLDLIFVW